MYLDSTKIDFKKVYSLLTENGFTKTTSKRFRRFEKQVKNKDYTIGVEIGAYNDYITLNGYATHTIGVGVIPFTWFKDLEKELKAIFKDYEKEFKIKL